jgi:hypothetical protein
MSEAVATTGILVKRGNADGPPETFLTIGEVTTITPPGYSRNKIESTTHNDGAESYVLGILRQKDPTFRINYVHTNASHGLILDDILANLARNWQFLFPSGVFYQGPARVQRWEPVEAPPDAIQQVDITLAWSGPVVFDDTP